MTPEVLAFQADADPCEATGCDKRKESIRECRRARCGFEWARASVEDRRRREEKDKQRMRDDA
jgi:hypothetical protein